MSGRVVRILNRTDYDYTSLGVSAATGEIPIAVDVDISGSRETTLLVRAHAWTLSNGAKFVVITKASAPTHEDPNNYFRDVTALTTTDAAISTGAAAPFLTRITIPANAGAVTVQTLG